MQICFVISGVGSTGTRIKRRRMRGMFTSLICLHLRCELANLRSGSIQTEIIVSLYYFRVYFSGMF